MGHSTRKSIRTAGDEEGALKKSAVWRVRILCYGARPYSRTPATPSELSRYSPGP